MLRYAMLCYAMLKFEAVLALTMTGASIAHLHALHMSDSTSGKVMRPSMCACIACSKHVLMITGLRSSSAVVAGGVVPDLCRSQRCLNPPQP